MEHLHFYVYLIFLAAVLFTVIVFYAAAHQSKIVLIVLSLWLAMQGVISYTGFYTVTNSMPPRAILLLVPPLLLIIFIFAKKKGRIFIDSLDIKLLTLLHIVRIPVELTLYWLFLNKTVPQLMTFEGCNFDILSGISALLIYFGLIRKQLNSKILLLWNFICLGLLINIVVIALLSMPTPFQKMAFEQPNIGVLFFPFTWLPSVIVPLVFFSHLASIRQLLKK
jgi:hypothetical protein